MTFCPLGHPTHFNDLALEVAVCCSSISLFCCMAASRCGPSACTIDAVAACGSRRVLPEHTLPPPPPPTSVLAGAAPQPAVDGAGDGQSSGSSVEGAAAPAAAPAPAAGVSASAICVGSSVMLLTAPSAVKVWKYMLGRRFGPDLKEGPFLSTGCCCC